MLSAMACDFSRAINTRFKTKIFISAVCRWSRVCVPRSCFPHVGDKRSACSPTGPQFSEIRDHRRALERSNKSKTPGTAHRSFLFADGTHSRLERRASKPMITFHEASTRCSGDGTEIIISLDCPRRPRWIRSVVRTGGEPLSFRVAAWMHKWLVGSQ